jgi:hypothetical protein
VAKKWRWTRVDTSIVVWWWWVFVEKKTRIAKRRQPVTSLATDGGDVLSWRWCRRRVVVDVVVARWAFVDSRALVHARELTIALTLD